MIRTKPPTRSFATEVCRRATCSPEAIMERVLSPRRWHEWQPEIVSADGPDRVSAGDNLRGDASLLGFDVVGHSSVLRAEPGSFEEDVVVGVPMKVTYEVRSVPGGSTVTARLEATLPRGLSGRVLSFFLRRRLVTMQRDAVEALVSQSEASTP